SRAPVTPGTARTRPRIPWPGRAIPTPSPARRSRRRARSCRDGVRPRRSVKIRTLAEAPALERAMHRLHSRAWPPFLRDDPLTALWPRLYTDFPEFQLALKGRDDRVVAIGNTVPFAWKGTRRGLPNRLADVLGQAVRGREGGIEPTALVALA